MSKKMKTQLLKNSGKSQEYGMDYRLTGTLVICLLLTIAGCKVENERGNKAEMPNTINKTIETLSNANPETDAKEAITKGDLRVIGIRGYSLEVPGVDDYYINHNYEKKYKVRVVEGTGDVGDKNVMKLNTIATEYALRYNKVVNDYLKKK